MTTTGIRVRYTFEDYLNTPDDERYELIDGELILAPAPRKLHQYVQANIGTPLHTFVRGNRLGRVYYAPRDVFLADTDTVQPDLLFISNERLHIDTEAEVRGAPDLVVEILSPSTAHLDRTVKRALYEKHGVKEYWQVDTHLETITVLLLVDGVFEAVGVYGVGDTLVSPTLPGLSIALDEVF